MTAMPRAGRVWTEDSSLVTKRRVRVGDSSSLWWTGKQPPLRKLPKLVRICWSGILLLPPRKGVWNVSSSPTDPSEETTDQVCPETGVAKSPGGQRLDPGCFVHLSKILSLRLKCHLNRRP